MGKSQCWRGEEGVATAPAQTRQAGCTVVCRERAFINVRAGAEKRCLAL